MQIFRFLEKNSRFWKSFTKKKRPFSTKNRDFSEIFHVLGRKMWMDFFFWVATLSTKASREECRLNVNVLFVCFFVLQDLNFPMSRIPKRTCRVCPARRSSCRAAWTWTRAEISTASNGTEAASGSSSSANWPIWSGRKDSCPIGQLLFFSLHSVELIPLKPSPIRKVKLLPSIRCQ